MGLQVELPMVLNIDNNSAVDLRSEGGRASIQQVQQVVCGRRSVQQGEQLFLEAGESVGA
eukprot:2428399-Ditylum_brightwellii.AAC.1